MLEDVRLQRKEIGSDHVVERKEFEISIIEENVDLQHDRVEANNEEEKVTEGEKEKGRVGLKEMEEGIAEKRELYVMNLSRKKCMFKESFSFLSKPAEEVFVVELVVVGVLSSESLRKWKSSRWRMKRTKSWSTGSFKDVLVGMNV